MKITERRLRSIIRSVIKEQRLNEMMDPHGLGMDDMRGAAGHASILNEIFVSEEQIEDALEYLRLGSHAAGLMLMLNAQSMGSFLLGASISVGACVYILIDEYKKRAKASEKRTLRLTQNSIMRDCDSCEEDVRRYYSRR